MKKALAILSAIGVMTLAGCGVDGAPIPPETSSIATPATLVGEA